MFSYSSDVMLFSTNRKKELSRRLTFNSERDKIEKTMASLQAFLSFLPRAPKFPLPLPFLTPATQAKA